jgi:hypothetical protein
MKEYKIQSLDDLEAEMRAVPAAKSVRRLMPRARVFSPWKHSSDC